MHYTKKSVSLQSNTIIATPCIDTIQTDAVHTSHHPINYQSHLVCM